MPPPFKKVFGKGVRMRLEEDTLYPPLTRNLFLKKVSPRNYIQINPSDLRMKIPMKIVMMHIIVVRSRICAASSWSLSIFLDMI